MQPQQSPPPTDSSQYGFIFQQNPKGRGFSLPKPNLPKPLKILLIAGAVFLLLIILLALKGGGGSNTPVINIAARQHEILRVSKLANGNLIDPQAQNLQANVTAIFITDQQQMISSLKIKSGDGRLNKYRDKSVDASLQSASQNNNYDAVYLAWLKQSLTVYAQAVQAAGPVDSNTLLSTDYNDAQALLAAPQFKSL